MCLKQPYVRGFWAVLSVLTTMFLPVSLSAQELGEIKVPDTVQRETPRPGLQLIESTKYIRADLARDTFGVKGTGLTVAVLDTGLRTTHQDFQGRVPAQRNFTSDNGGDPNNASDGNGHGTNVGGIIVAGKIHTGIAPAANIVPLKVLSNAGGGSFTAVSDALDWVLQNKDEHKITVVNLSLGGESNFVNDNQLQQQVVAEKIRSLRQAKVAVVISAGNHFAAFQSAQGMSFPGILRESISVGAVYDSMLSGPIVYPGKPGSADDAIAVTIKQGQVTPFSQRLHESAHAECRTDIFAPGAPVTSAGHLSDVGESTQHGTSQAAPVTAGVILLMQELYMKQNNNELPTVDNIEAWLRQSESVQDVNGDHDNVQNTDLTFPRIDAFNALLAVQQFSNLQELKAAGVIEDVP